MDFLLEWQSWIWVFDDFCCMIIMGYWHLINQFVAVIIKVTRLYTTILKLLESCSTRNFLQPHFWEIPSVIGWYFRPVIFDDMGAQVIQKRVYKHVNAPLSYKKSGWVDGWMDGWMDEYCTKKILSLCSCVFASPKIITQDYKWLVSMLMNCSKE